MPDRIALKRLSASDLTFFEWQFRNRNAGNQKSINLNANVFVEQLYPAVPSLTAEIHANLTLLGPGIKGPYNLARKIIKNESYKNWRLNGEFVHNPVDDPDRFNSLEPGDLALLRFEGEPVPTRIDLIVFARAEPADAGPFDELLLLVPEAGRLSMASVTREDLAAALGAAPEGHPILAVFGDAEIDAALEDAAYGNEAATRQLRRRAARRVSTLELSEARSSAERVGRDGEGLVYIHLKSLLNSGALSEVVWEADDNAAAPFDFQVRAPSGAEVKIDAKSTSGPFERVIHISAAEVAEAAESEERYDLYRIFEITDDGAKLRVTEGIRPFAEAVVQSLEHLPPGVRPDGFSVSTECFEWGPEVAIERPDEPEDGG